ncbi:serine hydrolase [Thaumasiovibrio sp. DFM-14]|uniref:serine hydrolase n=1 Tax=Thaumasiovibrio sp. DFM-14 TaxID=3384792 RepID=UPI00399FB517
MFKIALRTMPAACLAASFSWPVMAAISPTPTAPSIDAKGYVLLDYNSGQIISEKNAHETLNPASLTKMMTSYIIGQEIKQGNISLDDDVVISEKAWAKNFPGSSKMFIEVGTTVKVADLNRGIVIQSGNDASVAMAEHIAGSSDAFVTLMNNWAAKLAMENTQYANPHGLDNDNLYTTPYDMSLLAQALIRDVPEEFSLYSEKSFTYNGITQYNRNSLLWDSSLNVDGMKTGHTSKAGYSLVSTATQDHMRLIAVVMGTDSPEARSAESKKLLNYGFRFFDTVALHQQGDVLATERVWLGQQPDVALGVMQDIQLTVPRAQVEDLTANFSIDEVLEAPLQQGQQIGSVNYQMDGTTIATFPLVTMEAVEAGSWFSQLIDRIKQYFSNLFS